MCVCVCVCVCSGGGDDQLPHCHHRTRHSGFRAGLPPCWPPQHHQGQTASGERLFREGGRDILREGRGERKGTW